MDLLFNQEAYQIIGACVNVYNDKGHGLQWEQIVLSKGTKG